MSVNCSFCARNSDSPDLLMIVDGGGAYICDECICLCMDMLSEKRAEANKELRQLEDILGSKHARYLGPVAYRGDQLYPDTVARKAGVP